jgi:hypothetical protein
MQLSRYYLDRSPFEVGLVLQTPGNGQMLADLNQTGGETLLQEFLKQVVGLISI